jgi:hypothetical protein
VAHNGKPNFRHPERLRTEGTDHLLAAAQATGVSHVVAQSVATWTEGPDGGRVSEEDPLPSEEVGPKMRGMVEALRRVEDVVGNSGGAVGLPVAHQDRRESGTMRVERPAGRDRSRSGR